MSDGDPQALLGTGGTIFVGLYLLSLIGLGIAGRLAQKEKTLSDFYLAGRGFSFFVLFLTLYSTQYSGNTFIGFAAKSYRSGYFFLVSVVGMMSVICAYIFFAPKLQRLAKKHKFITLGDYLQFRYNHTTLTVVTSLLCIFALGNYILTNLKAIGYIVEASTGGLVPFSYGVIALAFIMVVYESLGGLRSVAWTDAIQGVLILLGCGLIFYMIQVHYGGLAGTADTLINTRPDLWQPPSPTQKRLWLSTIFLFFFGISLYPHAIQRIYAAKDAKTLRISFQLMLFMPLVTTFFMVLVGIVGAARFPDLSKAKSEEVTLLLLSDIAATVPSVSALIVLFVAATLAAIMSTIDSALLSLSSLVTQDLYRPYRPESSQASLTRFGKVLSWIVMAAMTYAALTLPHTIWRLIEIKLELLCQVAPSLFLGILSKKFSGRSIFAGVAAGLAVTLFLMLGDVVGLEVAKRPWGIHAGIWGITANFATVFLFEKLFRK